MSRVLAVEGDPKPMSSITPCDGTAPHYSKTHGNITFGRQDVPFQALIGHSNSLDGRNKPGKTPPHAALGIGHPRHLLCFANSGVMDTIQASSLKCELRIHYATIRGHG